jgi:hypothetical protein
MKRGTFKKAVENMILCMVFAAAASCAPVQTYRDPQMDFGAITTVAVMPFQNLTRDQVGADRVRDVFMTMLLASGGVYVVPSGEVAKGMGLTGVSIPSTPSVDEIMKLGKQLKADAVVTGVVREYGEVRSGAAAANVISLSLQMTETQTGKVVWSTSVTEGGVSILDRLFGGGGEPMNVVTEKAVKHVISKLF